MCVFFVCLINSSLLFDLSNSIGFDFAQAYESYALTHTHTYFHNTAFTTHVCRKCHCALEMQNVCNDVSWCHHQYRHHQCEIEQRMCVGCSVPRSMPYHQMSSVIRCELYTICIHTHTICDRSSQQQSNRNKRIRRRLPLRSEFYSISSLCRVIGYTVHTSNG